MHDVELIIALLLVVTLLAQVAERLTIPYPILLVLTGIGAGLVPGLPRAELAPELVFLVFLPPLLYSAAWQTSWPDFKAARRSIGLLALGCVLFTTTLVAVAAHYGLPGFGWAPAFVLGALISPTDTVAAAAALRGLVLPKRINTVLEGESLVNDATGLVAYRTALAAVLTGQFAAGPASLQLLWVAGAGIAIGLAVGVGLYYLHRLTRRNTVVETSLTFLTPYLAYLAAEEAHVSGVLAVVATGLCLSRRAADVFTPESRQQTYAVWNTVVFLLNGVVFVLIGLQLPIIRAGLTQYSAGQLAGYGLLISGAVIGARLLWVYPGAFIPRWLSRTIRERETGVNVHSVTLLAWTGMRGVVSPAGALALPPSLRSGVPFPQRDLILFLTFAVIVVTLVGQGLSLPALVRWLRLTDDGKTQAQERQVRLRLATRAAAYLDHPATAHQVPGEALGRMKSRYAHRLQRLQQPATAGPDAPPAAPLTAFQQLQEAVIQLERRELAQLRREAEIGEEVLRKIENELDLEEAQLALAKA